MAKGRSVADPGSLRVLWDVGTLSGLDDRALLARFVDRRDEGAELAFEALVRRHGPMVLRVSGQLLDDRHAAEDAFQAVFLVLARRAGSIRRPEQLAPWLHGVALRTAKEARSRENKRRRLERPGATMPPKAPKPPEDPLLKIEEAEVLHGEIARLPERYRVAVVLCDLEGLTHQEAASRLQCPTGTVAIRLKRARERLRDRLTRRGLDPTAGLMATIGPGTFPSLPLSLIESTVKASTAAGAASASALSLARGVEMSMTFAKWKAAMAGAVLTLGLASTWGLAGGFPQGSKEETQQVVPEVEVGRAVTREVRDYEDFIGRADPSRSLEIRANVAGRLETAYFPEGKRVKEGELLFEIDRKEARAALDLADAKVLKAEAQLKLALVAAQGQLDEASADLAKAKAELGVAEAARDQARLVLASTRIRAPFDGEISRSLVAPGDPIKASNTVLAKFEATDPMAVAFDVDEGTLLRLRREVLPRLLPQIRDMMGNGGINLPVQVALADDRGFPHRGVARFGGEIIDPSKSTARLRATIPNADHAILPGMFARVRMRTSASHEALLVPEVAVLTGKNGGSLYVLDGRDVVEERSVKLGQAHDDLRVVLEGVKAGERVVVGGLKEARPGMTVKPRPTPNPHP